MGTGKSRGATEEDDTTNQELEAFKGLAPNIKRRILEMVNQEANDEYIGKSI